MDVVENKYRLIGILMVLSLVMLASFLSFWLVRQYQEEKEALITSLRHDYEQVFDQQVDTLLMKNLIQPTIEDSTFFHFSFNNLKYMVEENDSIDINIKILNLPDTGSLSKNNGFTYETSIEKEHATISDPKALDSILIKRDSKDEMLVKSVKLFIAKTEDVLKDSSLNKFLTSPVDSASLLSGFEVINDTKNREVTISWAGDLKDINSKSISLNLDGIHTPEFSVSNYGFQLIKKISPQLLFALFLLMVTSLSLYLAWKALKKQTRLNAMRNSFVANMGHELKTPVSTVKVALEAIQNFDLKQDPDTTKEYLEMAGKEMLRLETMVEKVMQQAAMDSGKLQLLKEKTKLSQISRELLSKMTAVVQSSGASIHSSTPEKEPLLELDAIYVEAAMKNLIDNSLKYAGPKPVLDVTFRNNDHCFEWVLKDDGPGIQEEYAKEVFNQFFRVPNNDRHDVKGYGLGLHFVKGVMEAHNGQVSFKNLKDGGCEFTLSFNVADDEN
jgi:signal transduction histidine kinase